MLLTFGQGIYDAQERELASITALPLNTPLPPPGVDPVRVCGSDAAFLSEIPYPAKVASQWAPVVAGSYPARPTIDETLFYATGTIAQWTNPQKNGVWAGSDLKFSHPFGRDYSLDVALSPAGLAKLNLLAQTTLPLHVEIENGLFPYGDLGWAEPHTGDSVAVAGDWVVDCGNPGITPHVATPTDDSSGWRAEIHPPTFIAMARSINATTTDSIAMINPYRPTQLYNSDSNGDAIALNDCPAGASPPPGTPNPCSTRLQTTANTLPLPGAVMSQLSIPSPNDVVHALIASTSFGTIVWQVCAPGPRPAGATNVGDNYNFIVRTGISVSVLGRNPSNGCLQIVVQEVPSLYNPASLLPMYHNDDTWKWSMPNNTDGTASYDSEGFNDINNGILEEPKDFCTQRHLPSGCTIQGFIAQVLPTMPPFTEKTVNDPFTDRYDPLHALVGAGIIGTSPAITRSNSQPFPMTGHIQVWWVF
ncbi:MAG: hypothetical protein WAN39_10220 [Candidatus Cybelea sp.]